MDSTHKVRSFCSVTHSRWHAVFLGDGMAIWVVDDEMRGLLGLFGGFWENGLVCSVWEILY